jgi:hypothetical protein
MELMNSTSLLLAGTQGELATELANSTPQLLEIAKAAQKVNPSLGDTTFLYDSLSRGIKRNSPLILDNLGLVISIGEANEVYAESIGKTVKELTVEEEKIALLNAVLEQGDVLIQQAGGSVDSATDSFARMNTAVENASNSLKEKFAPFLADAAEAAATLITWQDQLENALYTQENNVRNNAKSYDEYRNEVDRAAKAAGYFVDEQGQLNDMVLTASGRPIPSLIDATFALTEQQWKAEKAVRAFEQSLGDSIDIEATALYSGGQLTEGKGELTEAIEDNSEAILEETQLTERSTEEILANAAAVESLSDNLLVISEGYMKASEQADIYTKSLLAMYQAALALESTGVDVSGNFNIGGGSYGGASNGGSPTGGDNINVYYQPFITTADRDAAVNQLRGIVEDIVRDIN